MILLLVECKCKFSFNTYKYDNVKCPKCNRKLKPFVDGSLKGYEGKVSEFEEKKKREQERFIKTHS